jgi:hypothetical protein
LSTRELVFPKKDITRLEEVGDISFPVRIDIRPVTRSKGVGQIASTGNVESYDSRTRVLKFTGKPWKGYKFEENQVFRIMLLPSEVRGYQHIF